MVPLAILFYSSLKHIRQCSVRILTENLLHYVFYTATQGLRAEGQFWVLVNYRSYIAALSVNVINDCPLGDFNTDGIILNDFLTAT